MSNCTSKKDMMLFEQILRPMISTENFPISYKVGSRRYKGFPQDADVKVRNIDSNITLYEISSVLPGTKIEMSADVLAYKDFATVEWTVYFTNKGKTNSKIISEVLAIDTVFEGEKPVLWHSQGDNTFVATETPIKRGVKVEQAPAGGRSCDHAYPYKRLTFKDHGINIAIGWSGSWKDSCERTKAGVSYKAGQRVFNTYMLPGEKFRTPKIVLQAFDGNSERGINVWRRWFNTHVMPKCWGELSKQYVQANKPGAGPEFTSTYEEEQISEIQKYIDAGIDADLWWIDAGWYPSITPDGEQGWYKTIGTWRADEKRFPNGLAPIGEKCAESNKDFLLWFEPERVVYYSEWAKDHPEWLLRDRVDPNEKPYAIMWNFADPDCVDFTSRYVADFLKENKVTVYRQDCNFTPEPYWRFNETSQRQGSVENHYIQGLLRYWDNLKAYVPGLVIDCCAAGGRRNDIEMVSRGVIFTPSDASHSVHPSKHTYYQSYYMWIPYFRGLIKASDDEATGEYISGYKRDPIDKYSLVSDIAPVMSLSSHIDKYMNDPQKCELVKKTISIYKECSKVLSLGDFYAHTPIHRSAEQWNCWQFHDPSADMGYVQMFRNNRCDIETFKAKLKAIDSDCTYKFTEMYSGEEFTVSGKKINKEGISFALDKRGAAIWKYTKA